MLLEIVLSVIATGGTYEFLYDVLPNIPLWATLPLLIGLSVAVYYLPLMWVIIVAVASAAGFVHGIVRKNTQQVVVQNRRSQRPQLP